MDSKSKLGARVEDRISQLPDELICHILSFLPTVDSVQTIVLSKRWSNLWTLVNTLDINFERDFGDPSRYNDFEKFVDGALSSNGSSNIKRFRLSCPRMSYYLPASGCFSSLKSLYLWVHYHDPPDIENLITNCCPVLEELEISGSIGLFPDDDTDDMYYFNISAPKLKRLIMDFFFDADGWSYVLLNATKLEHLYVKGINKNFILENPKSLDKAEIDQSLSLKKGYTHEHKMTKLLAGLSSVKDLSIRSAVFETCKLPAFNNLNKLELILHSYGEYITKFLERSPTLEHLILELDNKKFRSEKTFTPPEFVPVCLSSHLKTIYMRGFNGRWVELEVLNYLLGYGQVLDELTISSHPTLGYRKEESLSKEILLFPRASRTCEVKFM